ncbi:MAG: alpha/beta hydrolase [Waddliaceae bacterium]
MNAGKGSMIEPPSGLPIHYRGPPLEKGLRPALFYFATSAEESLSLAPINLPAASLADTPIRVYSSTLPLHGPGLNTIEGMERWAEALQNNPDLIKNFIEKCRQNLNFLIDRGYVDPEKIAVAGLSRGSFIATLLAAEDPGISIVLGYAPLINLEALEEFHALRDHPVMSSLSLSHRIEKLIHKKLRFYIGNRDQRVGTETCYRFTQQVVDAAFRQGIRSPHVELMISPSIGRHGHGTSPDIFLEGIIWLKKMLLDHS